MANKSEKSKSPFDSLFNGKAALEGLFQEFTGTKPATEAPTEQPAVRIKLNNLQYRRLLSGEELKYKVNGHMVLLVLPSDVRDAVQRTS